MDILIHDIRLAVELDGYPWHLEKSESDTLKTIRLEQRGLQVLRIRDERLPQISGWNISTKLEGKNLSEISSAVASSLLRQFELTEFQALQLKKLVNKERLGGERYESIVATWPEPPPGKSLVDCNEAVAALWDQSLNGALTPRMVWAKSNKTVWWRCPDCGESWQATVANRTSKNRLLCCKKCALRKRKNPKAIKVDKEFRKTVYEIMSKDPRLGQSGIAQKLSEKGHQVSQSGVHTLLKAWNLNTTELRIERFGDPLKDCIEKYIDSTDKATLESTSEHVNNEGFEVGKAVVYKLWKNLR